MNQNVQLFSVGDAAAAWNVSTFTVRRLIEAGAVRAVHVGARVLIPKTEVERAITQGVGKARRRRRANAANAGAGTSGVACGTESATEHDRT